jgi:aryl-alcohol dehydrogenase-like predicted oxidoreductase
VAIIVRVPLASGLLTGKLARNTEFEADDHRQFNRHGEAFDRGETFSGVDYDTGLAAVQRLQKTVANQGTLARWALRWILMFDAVSCIIPGARRPAQVEENAAASALPPLSDSQMKMVQQIYDDAIRPLVHHRW